MRKVKYNCDCCGKEITDNETRGEFRLSGRVNQSGVCNRIDTQDLCEQCTIKIFDIYYKTFKRGDK